MENLDLYYAATPNGWKISIMLEECELPYHLIPVGLGSGDQFKDEFLAMNPNAKMPVLVDHNAEGGPMTIFESGAILMYLAEKTGKYLPEHSDTRAFYAVTQWVFWQMGNLGPMGGQASHFVNYAGDEGNEYAKTRYLNEYDRILGVMDYQLERNAYLAGDDYSIADIASFPWLLPYKHYGFDLSVFPHLKRWFDEIKVRPAVRKGVDTGKQTKPSLSPDDKARKVLFGQTSKFYKK